MIHDVPPDQYIDESSRRGVVVMLLHAGDVLYKRARRYMEQAEYRFCGRTYRFCACHIKDGQDATDVQAIKLPQYRFFVNGSERSSHVGIMSDEEIAKAIFDVLGSHRGS